MSWDVYAVRAPIGTRRLEDLPATFTPPAVATADEVLATVREVVPAVDASDPAWLVLPTGDGTVEMSLGKGTLVHDLTFYIGGGTGAVPVVLDLCRRLAVAPFDTETGERLTPTSTPPEPPPPGEPDDDEEESAPGWRRWWQRVRGG